MPAFSAAIYQTEIGTYFTRSSRGFAPRRRFLIDGLPGITPSMNSNFRNCRGADTFSPFAAAMTNAPLPFAIVSFTVVKLSIYRVGIKPSETVARELPDRNPGDL